MYPVPDGRVEGEMDYVLTWNSTKKEVFNAIKDYPMAGVFEDTVDLLTVDAPYHVLKAWLKVDEKKDIEGVKFSFLNLSLWYTPNETQPVY